MLSPGALVRLCDFPRYAEFQRVYTPTAFREERIHWRVIIQLNLIRSVQTILAAISAYHRQTSRLRAQSFETRWDSRSRISSSLKADGKGKGKARADTLSEFDDYDEERPGDAASRYVDVFTEDDAREDAELDELAQNLEPLLHVEAMLKERLVPASEDEPVDLGAGPVGSPISALGLAKEVFVRPGRWCSSGAGVRPTSAVSSEAADEAQRVLFECRFDMMQLWASMRVREILALRRVRLEEESGL